LGKTNAAGASYLPGEAAGATQKREVDFLEGLGINRRFRTALISLGDSRQTMRQRVSLDITLACIIMFAGGEAVLIRRGSRDKLNLPQGPVVGEVEQQDKSTDKEYCAPHCNPPGKIVSF
jgi:hypothetical protein